MSFIMVKDDVIVNTNQIRYVMESNGKASFNFDKGYIITNLTMDQALALLKQAEKEGRN